MVCPVCAKPIQPGDDAQRIPRPQRAALGQKSGLFGLYDHEKYKDTEEDIIHYPDCCMGYFDPDNNPYIFDEVAGGMRYEIEEEVRDEIKDEYRSKLEAITGALADGKKLETFCQECWDEMGESEDPMCLWCKQTDAVWIKGSSGDSTIYCCTRCQKYWDEKERELSQSL